MTEKEDEFKIRSYSKVELACLYNPCMSISAAVRTLSRWIGHNGNLTAALAGLEYKPRNRSFTPRQVHIIVTYLGRP